MWSLKQPSVRRIAAFLAAQGALPYSYREVGGTRGAAPAGYDEDHNRIALGKGQAVFDAGCQALRQWAMFPAPWTAIRPANAAIEAGTVVAMIARAFGLWWLNACRIVYVFDETAPLRRFGFAYGTLPGHVESGEERFSIEWDRDNTVWYDVRAFSRPRLWLARLGYPLARRLQRRFVRESQAAMRRAVARPALVAGGG